MTIDKLGYNVLFSYIETVTGKLHVSDGVIPTLIKHYIPMVLTGLPNDELQTSKN